MSEKKKKKKDDAPPPADDGALRIAAHPRASAAVRRLRAWAGLGGLAVCLVLSLRAGLPAFDALLRGLAVGIAAQFVAWFAGVLVWRHLVIGELAAHRAAIGAARAERRPGAEGGARG